MSNRIILASAIKTTPGKKLNPHQKIALEVVAGIHNKRDVILAIDLTESVGINDEGRIRLRQIIEDSLKSGDSVYVVPFASNIVNSEEISNLHPLGLPIHFDKKNQQNIDKVLQKIPLSANLNFQNTDIQQAELTIYQGLAQLNQNRLQQNQPIKFQSIVWITDAPLLTKSGNEWIETPADSPFRLEDSLQSQVRQAWIDALPLNKREISIQTADSREYKLAVVDIEPVVQEFCTIAPNNQDFCKVNSYLFGQLWFPTIVLILGIISSTFFAKHLIALRKKWRVSVVADLEDYEKECRPLLPGKSFAIGQGDSNCIDEIDCPGSEVRAYLERQGNQLYLVPTQLAPIELKGREVNKRTRLTGSSIKLNCPSDKHGDFYLNIKVKK
ncbi:VWA domain-containing protein [Gloeocapsopsis crepidinum LEGE 06123]|uniref:VWA domain-containing protein n=1 Tax=Gloeocapsopsis crepidinum LEGE 06123 TaxID=588587 RepID=A0ABR9UUF3_9CHRO|nr:VWA domain-containing protein [Gloeocapsopsis crepidinum]MBE9190943.1 VWA domain-containing protein [Gloeocapsopsis crepidinum LEGE 06123]